MKIEDLSAEDQALLKQEFPAELEKEASEQVKVAQTLYTTGFEKFAQETADELDKLAEEMEKDEKEEKDEKKLSDEQKKEAEARGNFIAQGFIDGLKKLGSDRHGDEMAYLYPFVNEKLAMMGKVLDAGKTLASKATGAVQSAGLKAHLAGKAMGGKGGDLAARAGKAVIEHPGKAMAGATLATGATLAGLKAMGKKKED